MFGSFWDDIFFSRLDEQGCSCWNRPSLAAAPAGGTSAQILNTQNFSTQHSVAQECKKPNFKAWVSGRKVFGNLGTLRDFEVDYTNSRVEYLQACLMHRGSKTMQLDEVSRARRLAFLPSVEAVFEDFKGRRAGLLKALTCDIDELLRQCDPLDDKEALCLFGFPDGSWEVTSPVEDVPSERPEPLVGINHTMDRISGREQWLLFVASHSDSWLLSTALFAASPFDHVEKQRLFDLMTTLPTLYHIVSCRKMVQENAQDHVGSSGASHEISQMVQQNEQDLHVYSSGASHEISHVTTGTIEKLRTDCRPARGALARSSSSLKNANPLQKSKQERGSGEDHLESMKKRIKVVDPRKSEETAAAAATKSWEAGSSFSSLETSFRSAALDAASPLEFDLNQMPEDLG